MELRGPQLSSHLRLPDGPSTATQLVSRAWVSERLGLLREPQASQKLY